MEMSDQEKAKMISRRRMVSLLGLAAAAGFGALTGSDAEAQTAETPATGGTHGMQRRQSRRTGRHERRHARRTGHTAPATPAPAEAAPPK